MATAGRRSSRLATKKPVRYMEAAPTEAEESHYVGTILPLLAIIEPMPFSVAKAELVVRAFKAVMAGRGSRVVAYHPTLRAELEKAIDRVAFDWIYLPTGPGNAIVSLTWEVKDFLKATKKEDCYRA